MDSDLAFPILFPASPLQMASESQSNGSTGCLTETGLMTMMLGGGAEENVQSLQPHSNSSNCSQDGILSWLGGDAIPAPTVLAAGTLFYAYFTPIIIVVGLVGNSLSLNVFLSKNMRSLSASTYLAALSTSDLVALIFYVLIEWLIRGLPELNPDLRVTFMHVHGVCQVIMYFHYVSRFLSAWLVVAFTIERYIGVCHPLRRRHICTLSSTRKIVGSLVCASLVLNLWKPFLSVVHDVELWGKMCTTHPDHVGLSFVLDSLYAVLITLVPFVIITALNLIIIRKLVLHNRQQKLCKIVTEESVIRLEFTLILLVVSFCFIVFNVPYFATWCKMFLSSKHINFSTFKGLSDFETFQGVLRITRAVFYSNYCVNFFLYSITGAYFRRELKMLFVYRSQRYSMYKRGSRTASHSHTPQSWV